MKKVVLILIMGLMVGCFPTPPDPEHVSVGENVYILYEKERLSEYKYSGTEQVENARRILQWAWAKRDLPNPECLDEVAVYYVTDETFLDYAVEPDHHGVTIDYHGIEVNGKAFNWLFIREDALANYNELDIVNLLIHEMIHSISYCNGEDRPGHQNDFFNIPLWIRNAPENTISLEETAYDGALYCSMYGYHCDTSIDN